MPGGAAAPPGSAGSPPAARRRCAVVPGGVVELVERAAGRPARVDDEEVEPAERVDRAPRRPSRTVRRPTGRRDRRARRSPPRGSRGGRRVGRPWRRGRPRPPAPSRSRRRARSRRRRPGPAGRPIGDPSRHRYGLTGRPDDRPPGRRPAAGVTGQVRPGQSARSRPPTSARSPRLEWRRRSARRPRTAAGRPGDAGGSGRLPCRATGRCRRASRPCERRRLRGHRRGGGRRPVERAEERRPAGSRPRSERLRDQPFRTPPRRRPAARRRPSRPVALPRRRSTGCNSRAPRPGRRSGPRGRPGRSVRWLASRVRSFARLGPSTGPGLAAVDPPAVRILAVPPERLERVGSSRPASGGR